jgi:streptomycin 3"-adenylyltransferase
VSDVLGDDLAAVYLHGSAVLGGFSWQRSDLDILALSTVAVTDDQVEAVGATLTPLDFPGKGLELTLMTVAEASEPELPAPRFEVHVATGGPGGEARVMDGRGRAGDPDLVLHIAVCREYAEAIVGPSARELLGEIPQEAVRRAMRAEIGWGRDHAPLEYLILTAARAWLFFDSGRIASKIEAGEWAAQRDPEPAVIRAALARQRGAETSIPADAAHRFAARVERLLGPS